MEHRRRVVKLGGSLIEWPELPRALERWMLATAADDHQRGCEVLLVVGGGAWVERIRDVDARFQLGEEPCHWMAIDAMRITARLVAQRCQLPLKNILPGRMPELERSQAASSDQDDASRSMASVFCPATWLRVNEPHAPGRPLPRDWRVTADSIAARVATVWGADELVLLKSIEDADGTNSTEAWRARGWVDDYFPIAAEGLRSRIVALRSPDAR